MSCLYYSNTVNSLRAVIALEECECEYRRHWLDLSAKHHHSDSFQRLSAMALVPVFVDSDVDGDSLSITQSAAILLYVAEKTQRLLPKSAALRTRAIEWCMTAISELSPLHMLCKYLRRDLGATAGESVTYLERRLERFLTVLERELATSGRATLLPEFSVADVAVYPVVQARLEALRNTGNYPATCDWAAQMSERDTVRRATAYCENPPSPTLNNGETKGDTVAQTSSSPNLPHLGRR